MPYFYFVLVESVGRATARLGGVLILQEFFEWMMASSGLLARACLEWRNWAVISFGVGSAMLGGSFLALPLMLSVFVRRRDDLKRYRRTLTLCACIVLFCGITRMLAIFSLVTVDPSIEAVSVMVAGLLAASMVLMLRPLLPHALSIKTEAGLRESNEELRTLAEDMRLGRERAYAGFRGSPIALHTTTPDGTIIDVSDRWLTLMGWTREEAKDHIIGRPWASFHATFNNNNPAQPIEDYKILRSGGEVQDRPRQLVRRDGTVIATEVSKRLEVGRDGTEYIVCVVVDVSARKNAERALRLAEQRLAQTNKMEAIGQITGGVAHDFNNLLQAITGNLKLILARTKSNDPLDVAQVSKKINNALQASEQAARLTAQLLAFARRSNLNPQPFNPAKTLEDMRALIETTAGAKVSLSWYAEPGAGMCLADQSQLSNAVLNLVANARDAIAPHGRGTISISITKHRLQSSDGPADEAAPGDYLRIAVRDDGVGMKPEVRARAFEPFFTTKDVGKGTGLGLSSVHGFAGQSHGMVTIDSEPGHGSEVAILLPWHQHRPVDEPAPQVQEDDMPCGQGECILVVEDVDPVREVLCDTLTEIGYRVIEADCADKALIALQTSGTEIHAVLTDMAMPGNIDGLELCGVVRAKWRHIPIALMTGNMDPPRGARLPAGTRFLAKPYPPHLVAVMLREMLEAREAAA